MVVYNLFLDDWRYPKDVTDVKYPVNIEWCIVRTGRGLFMYIRNELSSVGMPAAISFDYDLGEALTGMDVLKHLLQMCRDKKLKFPRAYFHSSDSKYRRDMQAVYDLAVLHNPELKADDEPN